jgi:hypothetical protein
VVTVHDLQDLTASLATVGPRKRKALRTELTALAPGVPPSSALFAVPTRRGLALYVRRLDLPTAVRLAFGVPEGKGLLPLFSRYAGPGWEEPEVGLFRTVAAGADGREYSVSSQFEFSLVVTDEDATQVAGFHLVNADREGLYGRLMVVSPRFVLQRLAFRMLAFQGEYAACHGRPGPMEHRRPIGLLKHKGHETSRSMRRLLEQTGYSAFRRDPGAPEYWRVAARPRTILKRVKELGYTETGVPF